MLGIALPKTRRPADEEVGEIVLIAGSRDILLESAPTIVVVDAITRVAVVDVPVRVNATNVVAMVILLENVLQSVALPVVEIKSVITVADLVTFHAIAQILVRISQSDVTTVSRQDISVVNVRAVTAVTKHAERRRHTMF